MSALRVCRTCQVEMRPGRSQPDGRPSHVARGLCSSCWGHLFRRDPDLLLDYPKSIRSTDEVMEEWEVLREEGHTKRQAAERLGMTFAAFDRAFYRARAAGDERARPALGTLVRAS